MKGNSRWFLFHRCWRLNRLDFIFIINQLSFFEFWEKSLFIFLLLCIIILISDVYYIYGEMMKIECGEICFHWTIIYTSVTVSSVWARKNNLTFHVLQTFSRRMPFGNWYERGTKHENSKFCASHEEIYDAFHPHLTDKRFLVDNKKNFQLNEDFGGENSMKHEIK